MEGDADAEIHWRRVRSKILARRGHIEPALSFATEAVDLARATDDLTKRGKALMDLASVLEAAGRPTEAIRVIREALDVFERKGHVVLANVARARLQSLGASTEQR